MKTALVVPPKAATGAFYLSAPQPAAAPLSPMTPPESSASSRELHWCSAAAIQQLTRCRAVEPRQVCPGRGSPFRGSRTALCPRDDAAFEAGRSVLSFTFAEVFKVKCETEAKPLAERKR
jgi:hypothetical protein